MAKVNFRKDLIDRDHVFNAENAYTAFFGLNGLDQVDYTGFSIRNVIPLADMRFPNGDDELTFRVTKVLGKTISVDQLYGIEVVIGWTHPVPQATSTLVYGRSAQSEKVDGGKGNDRLVGGVGDDILTGGGGSDTYVYSKGDGNDRIVGNNSGTTETLEFGPGISISNLTFYRGPNNDDVVIEVANSGKITLVNQNADPVIHVLKVNGITWEMNRIQVPIYASVSGPQISGTKESSDGSTGSLISDKAIGSDAADQISLFNGNNKAFGFGGNDIIKGGTDNDTFDGGADMDTLQGGGGFDILTGGTGGDRFIVSGKGLSDFGNRTVITDFDPALDVIEMVNTRKYGTPVKDASGTHYYFSGENNELLLLNYYGTPPDLI